MTHKFGILCKKINYSLNRPNLDNISPLPHGVLTSFRLTAGGLPRLHKEDDISRKKTILMTSLWV
jgi:hypothetical protein